MASPVKNNPAIVQPALQAAPVNPTGPVPQGVGAVPTTSSPAAPQKGYAERFFTWIYDWIVRIGKKIFGCCNKTASPPQPAPQTKGGADIKTGEEPTPFTPETQKIIDILHQFGKLKQQDQDFICEAIGRDSTSIWKRAFNWFRLSNIEYGRQAIQQNPFLLQNFLKPN